MATKRKPSINNFLKQRLTLDFLYRKKTFDHESVSHTKLSRVLGVLDITAIGKIWECWTDAFISKSELQFISISGISSTLGSGIYVLAGQVIANYSGPSIILSFIIAGIATFFSGSYIHEQGQITWQPWFELNPAFLFQEYATLNWEPECQEVDPLTRTSMWPLASFAPSSWAGTWFWNTCSVINCLWSFAVAWVFSLNGSLLRHGKYSECAESVHRCSDWKAYPEGTLECVSDALVWHGALCGLFGVRFGYSRDK